MNSSKLPSLANRCIKESVEIRTQNRYIGEFYCGNDIIEGQEFRSTKNEIILITDLLVATELNSTGFVAHFTFESMQTTTGSLTEVKKTTIEPQITQLPTNITEKELVSSTPSSTESVTTIQTSTTTESSTESSTVENTSKQVNVSDNEIKTNDESLTTKSIKYSNEELIEERKSDPIILGLGYEDERYEREKIQSLSNRMQSPMVDDDHEVSLDILVSSLSSNAAQTNTQASDDDQRNDQTNDMLEMSSVFIDQ